MFPAGALKSWGTETDAGVLKYGLSEEGTGMLDFLIFTNFVSMTWQSICIMVTKSLSLLSPCCHSVPTIEWKTKGNVRLLLSGVQLNIHELYG